MIDILLGVMALMAVGFFCALQAAKRAPVGFQDEQGFQYGPGHQPETAEHFPAGLPELSR
jgi:hypothetical protein